MPDNELTAVRTVRREISAECGGDVDRVLDYYEEVQQLIKQSGRYQFVKKPFRIVASTGKERHVTNP
ncbi:MAG: hypothetical protein DWQ34_15685 [Planctomycetota bacterium]|nr:MAG: hypothetical protein DWQ29_07805 [Planctomycetota bacterium]REJ91179.1 MAG: hypothetical protein DWQ34_15685 [Planctomycetota bacterium]REK20343.1 MAG: hypothetical protein DWQ41_25475 [Planctomycetota bacterium]REK26840.1 MAG: hypothetical protein DWQ45_26775 [Planctomycetota bacterium]